MLNFVETANFKKLNDHRFEFSEGLNIICGDNAKGKTTLTQAIMTALYGVRSVPGSSDAIPTWGEKDFWVSVGMGGHVITRTLKNCEVSKAGDVQATGHTACNQYIEQHITGADLKTFKLLNWSEQGETSALLTIGATQLQRDVEKLSGVEFIDQMIKLAGVDLRDLQRDTDGFESAGSEEELKASSAGYAGTVTRVESRVSELAEKKSKESRKREELHAQVNEAEETNRSIDRLERKLITVKAELKADKDALAESVQAETEIEFELQGLSVISEHEYSEAKEALKQSISNLHRREAAQATIERSVSALAGSEEGLKADYALELAKLNSEKETKACRDRYDEALDLSGKAANEVARLEEAISSGVCSACGQLIADEAKVKEYKKALVAAEEDLRKKKENTLALSNKYAEAGEAEALSNTKLKRLHGGWKGKIKNLQDQCEQASEELKTLPPVTAEQISSQEEYLDQLVAHKANAEQLSKQLSAVQRKIGRIESDIEAKQSTLQVSEQRLEDKVDEATLQALKDSVKASGDLYIQLSDSLHAAEVELTAVKTKLAEAEAGLDREIKFRKKMEHLALLVEFVQYLKESRVTFLSSIWSQILGAASSFLKQSTGGVITSLARDDSSGFLFCEEGTYAPVTSASGAQRGFIGVAVRLALANSLRSSCPLVVLDEPTESMGEENARRLSGSLLSHGQVLMITHRVTDQYTASNVVEL